jgi:predicted negative regulator of RcsB-dependent stress response
MRLATILTALATSSLLGLAAAPGAAADTIRLTDGTSIEGVQVREEGLQKVTYKDGRKDGEVDVDKVLTIVFEPKPALVDTAEAGLAEDLYMQAIQDLEEYIASNDEPERKYPWALSYAMYRVVELNETMGAWGAVVAGADRLLAKAPQSRYAPLALLRKAEALYEAGKGADAMKALDALSTMAGGAGLGARWEVEIDLRRVLLDDSVQGDARVKKLEGVSASAGGSYPSVWGRAEVAIGEALLKAGKVADAEKAFRDVTKGSGADNRALAGAWSGLGNCVFARASAAKEAGEEGADAELRESALAFMRVVILYRDQTRYLSGALYWAGRSFDLIGDEESADRAQRLYREVIRNHKGTRWEQEARAFVRRS